MVGAGRGGVCAPAGGVVASAGGIGQVAVVTTMWSSARLCADWAETQCQRGRYSGAAACGCAASTSTPPLANFHIHLQADRFSAQPQVRAATATVQQHLVVAATSSCCTSLSFRGPLSPLTTTTPFPKPVGSRRASLQRSTYRSCDTSLNSSSRPGDTCILRPASRQNWPTVDPKLQCVR